MNDASLRPGDHFRETYHRYSSMLYKIAVVHLGNKSDAEEVVQEAFIRMINKAPDFHDAEHEKAWLIRVVTNLCNNLSRSFWRKRVDYKLDMESYGVSPEELPILESVLNLPQKYKAIIHLYYYEGYVVKEISEILQIKESAVKMRLMRGRQLLKLDWEGEQA